VLAERVTVVDLGAALAGVDVLNEVIDVPLVSADAWQKR
jgi:hypothetical protein